MPIPGEVIKIFQYVDSSADSFIENLRTAVAIKSVSTDKKYQSEIMRMIKWCEKWFQKLNVKFENYNLGLYNDDGGDTVRLPPVMLASLGHDKKKKTLCVYAHLDVVDANAKEWDTDPWLVTEKNRVLYGRGVGRSKGPFLCWLQVIKAYQTLKLPIPLNLKFIVCSTHEQGCLGLEKFLYTQRLTFLKGIDYVVVNGSEWLTPTLPCVTYACVGICHYEIICKSSSPDEIKKVLTDIEPHFADKVTSEVLITGVHEDVAQITPDEEHSYERIACKLDELRPKVPAYMKDWSQCRILMRYWRNPAIVFNDIEACKCPDKGTKVPAAVRKFLLKIVPHQTPERLTPLVMSHFKEVCTTMFPNKNLKFTENAKRVVCSVGAGHKPDLEVICNTLICTRPWMEDVTSPNYEAAKLATKQIYKDDASMIRLCRDLNIISIMDRIIGKNMLLLPMGSSIMGAKQPNERLSMRCYLEGTKLLGAYLHHLGITFADKCS